MDHQLISNYLIF
ncbi:hypothetical protein DF185_13310 [Marinifilum breve]|uniref:NERD domain-containing protein n=1 Tax=Marinifilum breve TaxID=2184082 RepID=A0A2V3ZX49_9BACT|nr:hypothetical protein DF185_13310 [Marinifilum breve]